MKRLLGIALIAAGCGAATTDDGGIDWLTDLKQARAEAKKAGKPLLVVFR